MSKLLSVRERLFCCLRTVPASLFALVFLMVLVLSANAAAAPAGASDLEEETIIVTASRLPQGLEEVPAAVEVITAEEILAAGVSSVEAALSLGANVGVNVYGDTGALATAQLQGATSNQVQVLLNGRPLNPGTSASVNLSLIPLGDVERIEIVKGPASAEYGANAVGGVVNIITRAPDGSAAGSAAASLSTAGEKNVSVTGEGTLASAAYLVTASTSASPGTRINSDFAQQAVTGRIDWEYRGGTLAVNARYSAREAGSPGPDGGYGFPPTPQAREADRALDLDLEYRASDGLTARVYHSGNSIIYDDPDDAWTPHSKTDSQVTGVEAHKVVESGAHRVVLGGEYRHDLAESTFYTRAQSADSLALYVEDLIETETPWSFTLAGRLDSDSRYGEVVSPRAAAVYRLTDQTRVWGAVGRAFRAPSFNELYWGGARQLDPEVATAYQLGAAVGPLDVTLYYKDIVNYLKWNGSEDVANVTSHMSGLDATYHWKVSEKVGVDLAYGWIDAVRASDNSRLTDVPKAVASATLRAELPRGWQALAKVQHQSAMQTNDYSTSPATIVTAPGFTVVDCSLIGQVNPALSWQVKLENALDAGYEKVPGYPMPGRTLNVGLNYRF